MSRSGYDDYEGDDNWGLIRYRGAVASAFRGARGQRFLKEMLADLDAMPNKVLVSQELEMNGQYCALGVVGKERGISLVDIDPEDSSLVAHTFGIAECMAREIVFENDEGAWRNNDETPEARWQRMRTWVAGQIK